MQKAKSALIRAREIRVYNTLESLVASEGVSGIIDALVEICDPKDLSSEEMKRSPSLGHNWTVLKAARLALVTPDIWSKSK